MDGYGSRLADGAKSASFGTSKAYRENFDRVFGLHEDVQESEVVQGDTKGEGDAESTNVPLAGVPEP